MANEPTHATLRDLEMPKDDYYAASTQYLNNYLWPIEDHFPAIDAELWKMTDSRAREYFQSVKIRDNAISEGKEPKRNFSTENRERANYTALHYMKRLDAVEDTDRETKGILGGRGEVRIAERCGKTMQKVQNMPNATQKRIDGKIEFRHACTDHGREANLYMANETRYGRLLISTEIYTCVERACISIDSAHIIGIGKCKFGDKNIQG